MSAAAPAPAARPFAAALDASSSRREPPWLTKLRAAARARFDEMGLPRPGDEDWRQTNVRPLGAIPFTVAASAAPRGAHVESLREAIARRPEVLEPHLGRIAPFERHPFVALNTAVFEDGTLVFLPAGTIVDEPIRIVHEIPPGVSPVALFPRTLVIAGAGARATVVESFIGPAAGVSLAASVTEIVLEPNAAIEHVKVQSGGPEAWHVASIAGRIARDARMASHNVSWGGKLSRNDVGAVLDGEGAECHLYGLYLADGAQHVDNHTWLDHAKPHGRSWEMYKGVLAGSARAVFNGRIIVREGAQKTDAKQSNKNLILSDAAAVFTRPQLEIYANDVKCTHGATIGRLDEEALFYLRSRGLLAAEARDLLIHAFADDVLGKIPDAALRAELADALYARLERDLAGRP